MLFYRQDVREEALSEIVKAFTHSTKPEIVKTKYAESFSEFMFFPCLNLFRGDLNRMMDLGILTCVE